MPRPKILISLASLLIAFTMSSVDAYGSSEETTSASKKATGAASTAAQNAQKVLPGDKNSITSYCERIRTKLVRSCRDEYKFDRKVTVNFKVSKDGRIDLSNKPNDKPNSPEQTAEKLLLSLNPLHKPSSQIATPLALSFSAANFEDDVDVCLEDVDWGPYMADLQRRIKKVWYPPKKPDSKHAAVTFDLRRDGTASNIHILDSSGDPVVDQQSLKAVENASPFSPFFDGSPRKISIQFVFDYNVFNKSKGQGTDKAGASNP